MNARRLALLGIALVVLAGIALLLARQDQPRGTQQGELLLPELGAALDDVERVVVTGPGNEILATLERGPARWTVAEADGYPANLALLGRTLRELSEARIAEAKTAKPEFYDRLGVQGVTDESATGLRLDISGPEYAASLIIGQTDVAGGGRAYVRRPDQAQSYMIEASLDPADTRQGWLDRELLDIPSREVREVRIEHPDGEVLTIEKSEPEATEFQVADIPPGRELSYPGVANSIGAALANLQFDAVRAAAAMPSPPGPPVLARFQTFDGLTIEARVWRVDDHHRVAFSASATSPPTLADESEAEAEAGTPGAETTQATDEPDAAQRAAQLNERLDGWLYGLPDYKTDQLIKRMGDLLAAEDQADEAD